MIVEALVRYLKANRHAVAMRVECPTCGGTGRAGEEAYCKNHPDDRRVSAFFEANPDQEKDPLLPCACSWISLRWREVWCPGCEDGTEGVIAIYPSLDELRDAIRTIDAQEKSVPATADTALIQGAML